MDSEIEYLEQWPDEEESLILLTSQCKKKNLAESPKSQEYH